MPGLFDRLLPGSTRLESSLLLRMAGAIAAIAMLALLGMAGSALVAESTQGSGQAINLAGSLRMRCWQMAGIFLAGRGTMGVDSHRDMTAAMNAFEETLVSPPIRAMLSTTLETELDVAYREVQRGWFEHMRPRFLAFASGEEAPMDRVARGVLIVEVRSFVARINELVKHMEETTEAKILVMRMVLGGALLLTVIVVILTVYLLHTQFVQPLRDLLGLAVRVGQGDLLTRTEYTGEDELGQLGRAFNAMAEDLSKLYGDLESRVRQQTAELSRSNQSLELLYHSISRLHGAPPGRETYLALLRDIREILGLGSGLICLGERGGESGQVIAQTFDDGEASPCDAANCTWCHGTGEARLSIAEGQRQYLTLPLADAEQQYGVLILSIPTGHHMETWQVQLLEALSRHIGVAIGAERRIEQNRRISLLEERAVIARELHDSLAQSLAYMKIQVSRMKSAMRAERPPTEISAVLEELREGLNSAYRQLRELLSTFRLKMEDEGLATVLDRTVREFGERGGIPIELDLDVEHCPLSPNEEIHVLHIVREALSNVLHHAGARHVRLAMRCGEVGDMQVVVEDDGRGIIKPADVHHYGMTIMEERARTLRGEVRYERPPQGGTRVVLAFRPQCRRAGAPLRGGA